MGLLTYYLDQETRLIHFCKHEVIKDMVPDKVDVVSGTSFSAHHVLDDFVLAEKAQRDGQKNISLGDQNG